MSVFNGFPVFHSALGTQNALLGNREALGENGKDRFCPHYGQQEAKFISAIEVDETCMRRKVH